MKRLHLTRSAAALLAPLLFVCGTTQIFCQMQPGNPARPVSVDPTTSTLPAAQPTALPPARQESPEPAHHMEVAYIDGKLAVDATNASLNQILREVAHKTGIKITGGVADERVFGQYGPSTPAIVLAALLDGTESNMLLVDDAKGSSELILTPRHGGATPPNPNAASLRGESEDEEGTERRYQPPIRPFQPPVATGRGPISANPDGSPSTAPPAAPDQGDSSQPNSGPKTPQQIYDQLQRQRQGTTPTPQ